MKKNRIKFVKTIFAFTLIVACAGCGEMLENPTKDKDTGEDINFLIVDFNFFTTRTSYKFIDASDNSVITKPAKIWFTGSHANDIVNFAGEKNTDYFTSEGQMELTVDPNLDINESAPMEYAVHVEVDGYLPFSQGIQINSEGKKTFELLLTKESAGEEVTLTGEKDGDSYVFAWAPETIKSGNTKTSGTAFEIKYRIQESDLIKFEDIYNQNFPTINEVKITLHKYTDFSLIVDRLNYNGITRNVGFQRLELGTLIKITINGHRIVDLKSGTINLRAECMNTPQPDIFGFANFNTDQWLFEGSTDTLRALGANYNLISASKKEISQLGCKIGFSSDVTSSFSIDADINDKDGKLIKTVNFKGNFPETFILENVPAEEAQIVFRNNNPSFQTILPLNITDLSTGSYNVTVNSVSEYEEYQVIFKALCADNTSIAVAPTYSAEIRIADSAHEWQGVDMIGGKIDILAKPNEIYEIRLLWKADWETTTFSTKFDANDDYVNNTDATIAVGETKDGRKQFKITHTFDQSICEDMDW